MWVLSLLLGLLVVLAITAATGYFVAQEFAYMAVDRSRLNARAADGDGGARRALQVTRRTSFMLSGAQLGITVTGLLVGYVAEPLIGESIGEALGGVGVPRGVGIAIGTVGALLLSTLIQMLFGELFPKNLAIARPEPVAVALATSTNVYLKVLGWLIRVFDSASNALLRLLRIEPVHDVEHSATARDLEHIVAESAQSGDLPRELSMLLDRILDFPEQDVEHAMIPRSRVDVVRTGDTVAEVREVMATGHSRYPVLGQDEEVRGVVHLQDVLAAADRGTEPVEALMRPAELLPTSMTLPDALRRLAAGRNQLACVLDEYGGLAGVLTFEDLAEELVGEITDEHDTGVHAPTLAEDDGAWTMAGDVHVDEVERAVGRDLPRDDYETIGGLVIAAHGSLPPAGTSVVVLLPDDPGELAHAGEPDPVWMRVDVLEIERHVPSLVRVTVPADPPPTEDERETAVSRDQEEDR
ncbi:hemolysin family protein [Cellulomonas triticagri]|uniref:HlyC/CorC family transporter n=1 Tax=Cellulomonas triticagri TaxID=2483352 RepID=A0A3M2JKZ9_9CELL|nr:hemolysin family protein [Cellulomonas triticagri]RMI12540.1 HlyC/CorC family transporter [Cellulomonas triticagri]